MNNLSKSGLDIFLRDWYLIKSKVAAKNFIGRMIVPGETAGPFRGAEGAMPHSLRQKGLERDEIWKALRCAGGATAGIRPAGISQAQHTEA